MLRGRMCTFPQVVTGSGALPEKLSYASINWIRFEGSPDAPCHGARWPLSPLPGLP